MQLYLEFLETLLLKIVNYDILTWIIIPLIIAYIHMMIIEVATQRWKH